MEKIFPLVAKTNKDSKEKLFPSDWNEEQPHENSKQNCKCFLLVSGAIQLIAGTYFTYLVGIISTLEKRYGFDSKTSGLILIADSISGFIISYSLKSPKRDTKYEAIGSVLIAASGFMCTVPYVLQGHFYGYTGNPQFEDDKLKTGSWNCSKHTEMIWVVGILFTANFLRGVGQAMHFPGGLSIFTKLGFNNGSIMDNCAMGALRIFGPTLGFLLSSLCLKYYEDPFYDPGIDSLNPRWVGAWWIGFLILGVALLLFTLLLALFPRELPARFRSEKKDFKSEELKDKETLKLKDFSNSVKKLMKNPILVCHVISVTFQINGFAGYFVFMPKFLESQYHQSASDASLLSGATGIVSMLVGILIGGFMIKKYKPRPKILTGYMVLVEMFSVAGLLASVFLGCPSVHMPGTTVDADETLNLYNECNANCSCTRRVFEPVCAPDGVSTFFSPCFAGCANTTGLEFPDVATVATTVMNASVFQDCKCIADAFSNYTTSYVTSGFCSTGCTMFLTYIIILCISKFISSTARVGNTLITFRCVDAEDKSFALGVFGSVLSLFAFIPYPLVYGALTDSTCLVWEESCSKTGNCWLYDSDKFRNYLHGMSILLISIGICFDIVVFFLSDRMSNFYGEDDEDKASVDRLARWIKEEEDEDIIFTKCPRSDPTLEMDPIM